MDLMVLNFLSSEYFSPHKVNFFVILNLYTFNQILFYETIKIFDDRIFYHLCDDFLQNLFT